MSPIRICSFLPSATEIIYALGLDDSLFGVTHECDYPQSARSKPKLTKSKLANTELSSKEIDSSVRGNLSRGQSIYDIDFETLCQAEPDLIFTQELCEVCAVSYGEIFKAGARLDSKPEIISLDTFTLEDILSAVSLVGKKCNEESGSQKLVASLRERIRVVKDRTKGLERKKVFFMEWIDPIMASGHWVPEVVEIAGGFDGLGNHGKNSRRIEWAAVRQYAPEFLIISPCGFGVDRAEKEAISLQELEGWSEIPAVKNDNVYVADGNAYYSRPGPRIVDGIEILYCILNSKPDEYGFGSEDYRKLAI